jgi:hypothetical protein
MSQVRRELFALQKERIEMAALSARQRRGSQAFIVLVLDLADKFARQIAATKSSESEVQAQIQAAADRGLSPCLIMDTSMEDADVYFEHQSQWPPFKVRPFAEGAVRVAVVGDNGISYAGVSIPT